MLGKVCLMEDIISPARNLFFFDPLASRVCNKVHCLGRA